MKIKLPGSRRTAASRRRRAARQQQDSEVQVQPTSRQEVDDTGYPIREGYQPCGGGRRIIRKRIGSD